jgi:hypothetical protein
LWILLRNLWLGGAVSVPMIVSAVSENPVATRAGLAGRECAAPGLTAAETSEIAAKATSPTSVLSIGPE